MVQSERYSRREALGLFIGAVGFATSCASRLAPPQPEMAPQQENPLLFVRAAVPVLHVSGNDQQIAAPESQQGRDRVDLRGLHAEKHYTHEILAQAHEIMSLSPDVAQFPQAHAMRVAKERALVDTLDRGGAPAGDFISALKVVATIPSRAQAMESLHKKRQWGELRRFGIEPISGGLQQWAQENEIDPRTLAIARDVHKASLTLLQAAPDVFLKNFPPQERYEIPLINRIPNPGILAALQMSETGFTYPKNSGQVRGFVNIGAAAAIDELNTDISWFRSAKDDLHWVARELQEQTDLPYSTYVNTIPGSVRGSGDSSGGALGPQFMPNNLKEFMGMYKQANARLANRYPDVNPFEPWTAFIITNLYLVNKGYRVVDGDPDRALDPRFDALMAWNPSKKQMTEVLQKGNSYSEVFGRT